jgi:peptidoglycan-N-acetylglucosamine deacetylase
MQNMMSVDLEDYYCDLPFSEWKKYPSRVVTNTKKILKSFKKHDIKATFFTLGYIAETYPDLIHDIVSDGHEIASHGYRHLDVMKMTPTSFEEDVVKSLEILNDVSGQKVIGFRAPFFSITENNLWTFKILKKYLKYDSSIFPVRTPQYGIPSSLRTYYPMSDKFPLHEDPDSDFFEIPLSTLKIPILGNIPIAGGFYLRFLPLKIIQFGINKLNMKNSSAVFYIHPKDLDPNMPKIQEYAWHYYWGLKTSSQKFESLLNNFSFSSIKEVLKF